MQEKVDIKDELMKKTHITATSWRALFNQPIYKLLPALSIQHVRAIKMGETLNGHPLTVWEDDSLFNMDAAFTAPANFTIMMQIASRAFLNR